MLRALLLTVAVVSALLNASASGDESRSRAVGVAGLAVFVAPDERAMVSGHLAKGEHVQVLEVDGGAGWATIQPPPGSFSWVAAEDLELLPGSQGSREGMVRAERTRTRAGIEGALLPGPPSSVLPSRTRVRLLDRPALTLEGVGGNVRKWLAMEPPEGTVRYVRAEGLSARRFVAGEPPGSGGEIRARFDLEEPPDRGGGEPRAVLIPLSSLPEPFASQIAAVEATHRRAVSGPVETWSLEDVRKRFEALLADQPDAVTARAIVQRLEEVAAHQKLGDAARAFRELVASSRKRDKLAEQVIQRLIESRAPSRRPFAAEGLMQPSSRQVDGHRVYALIGVEGRPIAYLDVPPGLDARPLLSKRVGARGTVRYNEKLGSRLIMVRELEPLE